jgi:hypothetical protein
MQTSGQFLDLYGHRVCAIEAAEGIQVHRLKHSQKVIDISRAYSTLPGTQSESDGVPEPTWSSIYTTEYNRMHATIVYCV